MVVTDIECAVAAHKIKMTVAIVIDHLKTGRGDESTPETRHRDELDERWIDIIGK
jgi:hypothetical protein